jgi:hypothetical protein
MHTSFRDLHSVLPLCESSGATFSNIILAHHSLLLERQRHLVRLGQLPGKLPLRSCRNHHQANTHAYDQTTTTVHLRQPRSPTIVSHQSRNFPTNPRNGGRGNHGPYVPPPLHCAGDIHRRRHVLQQVPKHHTSYVLLDVLLLLSDEPHLVDPGLPLAHIHCCLPP